MSENREHMLVVDLEATCWRGHPPKGMKHEIIEIGLVVLDNITHQIIEKDSLINTLLRTKSYNTIPTTNTETVVFILPDESIQ